MVSQGRGSSEAPLFRFVDEPVTGTPLERSHGAVPWLMGKSRKIGGFIMMLFSCVETMVPMFFLGGLVHVQKNIKHTHTQKKNRYIQYYTITYSYN